MILQLSPLIPLDTPKGPADAFFVIDYGRDAPLIFVCFVRETGESWAFEQREVKLEKNITSGIRATATAPCWGGRDQLSATDTRNGR